MSAGLSVGESWLVLSLASGSGSNTGGYVPLIGDRGRLDIVEVLVFH